MGSITYTGVLTTLTCFCGIRFAVPSEMWQEHYYRGGREPYCPMGHQPTWTQARRDEVDEANQRADHAELRLAQERDQRRAAERSAIALRGHMTRLRNRIANGTCPWCQRHFSNVMRHVETKHPEHASKARDAVTG